MFLQAVNNPSLEAAWLNLPQKLYRDFPCKPLMLINDVSRVFDPRQNSLLQKASMARWVIYDAHNLCAGRIAAFFLPDTPYTGRIGFFECREDEKAAHALLDAAKQWLQAHGCRQIEGPVNFGEKDRFWGLLTRGFDTPSLYLDNYNPPWYRHLFTTYGFVAKDTIDTYYLDPAKVPVARLEQIVNRSHQAGRYTYRHFTHLEEDRFITDIHAIYAASFDAGKRIDHISADDIRQMLQQVKPLLNEKHFWLAYADGHPAGFLLFLNEPVIKKQSQQPKRIKGFAFATIPTVRGRGIETGLCLELYRQLLKEAIPYELFLSGINASTVKMHSLLKKTGAEKYKEHQTFIYTINEHE